MYFIFAAIATLLLSPLIWAIALLLIGLWSKKQVRRKRLFILSAAVLIVFSNTFLLSLFAHSWNIDTGSVDKHKVYSAAIVLGGFSSQDASGKGNFNAHADRFIQGLWLKTTGQVSHIFISGGNLMPRGDGFTEAVWVKDKLKECNVPDSAILFENRSRNTMENATFTRQVLQHANLKGPYLLVTSSYHMRRSMYIFKKAGLEVIPYSCDYIAGNDKLGLNDYILPSIYTLNNWGYYLKEIVGFIVAHFQKP